MQETQRSTPRKAPLILLISLLGLSVFMYVSIAYKIIHYGP